MRRASRGNGALQKSRVKAIYSFSKILGLKPHQKSSKNVVNLIDVPEKTASSEDSIRYPECCQKLIDAYPHELNRYISYIRHSLVEQKLQKLDSVILNKVIIEDNIECALPNVEISLRIFLTRMVTHLTNYTLGSFT